MRPADGSHRLSGLADPLGLRTGFLIPVFSKPQANTLFVEKIGHDGTVVGFDALHPQDTPILAQDGGVSRVGQPPHWGFGLGNELLFGQGSENYDQLEAAMDTPFLQERPMLSLEVAEFLGLRERRTGLAFRIFKELSVDAGPRWRDATILTSDLRQALARYSQDIGVDFSHLVARVENSTVVLAGVGREARNLKMIQSAVSRTMNSLRSLYPKQYSRWDVQFVDSAERVRERGQKPGHTRGVVYVADEQIRGFPSPDQKLVDGLRIFQSWEFERFRAEANRLQIPSFILYSLREHLPRIERLPINSGTMWPLGVALRDSSSPIPRTSEINALDRYQGTNVIVAKPPSIFAPAGFTGELRDALNFMADAYHGNLNQLPFEAGVFLRARGNQPNQASDAWLQIYERCIRQGIASPTGLKFEESEDAGTDASQIEALFLPGLLSLMTDKAKFPGRRAIHAAAIVQLDEAWNMPDRQHEERSVEFLRRLGFDFDLDRRQGGWNYAETEVDGFEIRLGYGRSGDRYRFDDVLQVSTDDIRRFTIVDEADPQSVLEGIAERRELLVTLRDVAILNGPTPNVWLLLGSQMRRFASSVASKSRTHYFALLVEAARRQDRLPRDWASFIIECLQSGRLGTSLHIVTSQAAFERGVCSLAFRFVDRLSEFEKTDRLKLFIDKEGPYITEFG